MHAPRLGPLRLLAGTLLLLGLAGCTADVYQVLDERGGAAQGASAPPAAPPLAGGGSGQGMSAGELAFAREVLRLTNQERTSRGLPALAWDEAAAAAAYGHSADMDARRFFNHTNPSRQNAGARLAQVGVTGLRAWGENIARGQRTPADVLGDWMTSRGHRDNILSPLYTHLGVGVHAPGDVWWTQVFVRRW